MQYLEIINICFRISVFLRVQELIYDLFVSRNWFQSTDLEIKSSLIHGYKLVQDRTSKWNKYSSDMNNERSNCDFRCPNIDWSNTQYNMPPPCDLPKTNPESFDKNFLFSRVSHPQRGLKFHHSAGKKNVAKMKTKHFHQTNKNTTPNRLHPSSYGIAKKKHPKSLVENKINHHKNTSPLHAPGVQTFLAPIPQKLERDFGDGIRL